VLEYQDKFDTSDPRDPRLAPTCATPNICHYLLLIFLSAICRWKGSSFPAAPD